MATGLPHPVGAELRASNESGARDLHRAVHQVLQQLHIGRHGGALWSHCRTGRERYVSHLKEQGERGNDVSSHLKEQGERGNDVCSHLKEQGERGNDTCSH